ncbi:hypothetical protein LINPERHAP1_LOCUS16133 [Linum perenne]
MAATNFNGGLDAADPNLVEADAGNDDVIAQVVPSIDNADGQNAVITGSGVAQADPTAIVDEVKYLRLGILMRDRQKAAMSSG